MGLRGGGIIAFATVALFIGIARADDWPMSGRDRTRNAVSPEKHAPTDWQFELLDDKGKVAAPARNVKWKCALGSNTFGSAVVSGGLVWVCTNNERHRDPRFTTDMGALMCFDERDGKFRWQYLTPRMGLRWVDPDFSSVGSTPLVEGERLYFITNRWEVVCLDIGPLLRGTGEPREVWKLDMPGELKIAPFATIMSPSLQCAIGASYKGMIYVITGNGIDSPREYAVRAPGAPALICLQKDTGKLIWEDHSPGKNILMGQWSSPLVMDFGDRAQVIAPQGDGWIRSFDAITGKLIWKCDANAKGSVFPMTRNPVIAAPVLYEGRIYVATGQDIERGEGPGALLCIDPTKQGDVSEELDDGPLPESQEPDHPHPGRPRKGKPNPNSGIVWKFDSIKSDEGKRPLRMDTMSRTMASVVAAEGLVIATDIAGNVHCLDAKTGHRHWVHDTEAAIIASPLICNRRVYIPTENGDVVILALSPDRQVIAQPTGEQPLYCAPIIANGVLYLMTRDTLYAIAETGMPTPPISGEWAQWRGPERTNIAADTGLLDQWPAGGPPTSQPTRAGKPGLDRTVNPIFVPTPQDVVETMLALARVTKDDLVYDLGCGDGRIVVTAARKYGCRAAGYDIDPECIHLSEENVRKQNVGGLVDIVRKDVFSMDLSDASVVMIYLGRDVNRRLLPQLGKLKPGSRVVSHNFEIEGVNPDRTIEFRSAEDDTVHTLYLWTAPLEKQK